MILSVPATSANLGPGFDALGLALSLRNEFEVEECDRDELLGCDPAHAGPDNLFLRSARRAAAELDRPLPPLRVRFSCPIPLARGLGSSASLIVAGILAASRLLGAGAEAGLYGALDEQGVLDLACEIEGHPDNTTPALLGGFSVAVREAGRVRCLRRPLGRELRFAALVPPFPLETAKARAALPSSLPFADAAFSAGRAALVTAAFLTRSWDLLGAAMEDRLHEPWRASLIPGFVEMREGARKAGALAVWLSGAGPTILAAFRGDDSGFTSRVEELSRVGASRPWSCLILDAEDVGARLLS